MIIAIDGTTSSGKTSISKALGAKLNCPTINTGSIYRAIAYKTTLLNIQPENEELIKTMLNSTIIEVSFVAGNNYIKIDGLFPTQNDLSSPEISNLTPKIANKPFVREFVRKIQKQLANDNNNIIVEGRDIGSVVFPNADFKFYIDADIETRAKRRLKDYISQGKNYSLQQVVDDVLKRDNQDQYRDNSPLIMTSDSILIDTTDLTIEQCVKKLISIIEEKEKNN